MLKYKLYLAEDSQKQKLTAVATEKGEIRIQMQKSFKPTHFKFTLQHFEEVLK